MTVSFCRQRIASGVAASSEARLTEGTTPTTRVEGSGFSVSETLIAYCEGLSSAGKPGRSLMERLTCASV